MTLKVFKDVPDKPLKPLNNLYGLDYLSNIAAIQIGYGSKAMKADESGLWLGANKWASAPFRVDMNGNVTMTSATITGYIPTGGAANDVNSHTTTISGDKITTGTLDANRIKTSTLTAAVNVGSGTGYVKLDGGNNRIIINDGTNNRIVIGNV